MDVAKIGAYFKKFGKINDVSVFIYLLQLNGEEKKAIVTFSKPEEAEKAFKSPGAVFNNRFIKV